MSCTENNKTIAHHLIRDRWAMALQCFIAAAGYILFTAKFDTEKLRLLEYDTVTNPPDVSFDIDPDPSPEAPASCGHFCVGGNITINSPVEHSAHSSENLIEFIAAAVDAHLQDKDRLKLIWRAKKDTITGTFVEGDQAIGELL